MKMKERTKKKIRGSISVLMVIILLPMLTFSALIVDMSRINMARQMMSSAGDLTMNTALANYDTILKDVYGLFAMSQVEGKDNAALGKDLDEYFAKTLVSYGVVEEEDAPDYLQALIGNFEDILNGADVETTNFLELNNINLTATKVEGSSLDNASVMRKQIVEYMKYRAPLGVGTSFLDAITAFEKVDDQNKVVEAQVAAQESTQDVTKACQTLINLIRAYDKRVVEVDKALTGATGSTNTTVIPLEDYDTHVEKYLSAWNENYKHINKLNLVFLANSPSVDSVYLKGLNYVGGVRYVKSDGSGPVYNGSGINLTLSLAGDTANAKAQVDNQITNLNNNYKSYTSKYSTPMLPSTLLTYNSNGISNATIIKDNEEKAIDSFITFEKFLLDQSGSTITYSQVKAVLEQIYTLGKYLDNFNTKIDGDISTAKSAQQTAQTKYNNLVKKRDEAAGAMNQRITNINTKLSGFAGDDVDKATEFLDGQAKKSEIVGMLSGLPGCGGNYEGYYNSYLKSGDWDIYIEMFDWLVYDSSFGSSGSAAEQKVISVTKQYLTANGYDANGYDGYMREQLNPLEEGTDLFKLLTCLKTCHAYCLTFKNNITPYNEAAAAIPEAERVLNEAKAKVAALEKEKTDTNTAVKRCLSAFHTFCTNYQADAYYYNYYKVAAENTIAAEAKAIQTHFTKLLGYLDELRQDLDEISKQITTVKKAIETYNTNLNNWSTANTNYSSANGSDSFSSQTADDIEKARTEYDAKLYDTLDTFVIALWNEYDDLYTKLTDANNFKYGSLRIDTIDTAAELKSAVSGTSLSAVVTVEEADSKLASLYKGETVEYDPYTMNYTNPKQLQFLTPQILQIQALKYLNSAYPDASLLTEADKTANAAKEQEYENAKSNLTGKSQNTVTSSEEDKKEKDLQLDNDEKTKTSKVTTDFGYTYKSKTLLEELPSTGKAKEKDKASDTEYKLSETGEGEDAKLDASSGVSSQSAKSNSALEGIGNIATTAVENLYILNYVFENFSYNTIVQEQVVEDGTKDGKITSSSVFLQMTDAQKLFNDADAVSKAKEKTTTLSNFPINEKNNHLYGAEIEYILFGNSNPATNVTSTKASIYAIRFVFNCIFAFTDSEIRNSTMAAGLAVQAATLGIVPYQVVQIVLQLALAAAESALDLSAMDHGLKVAIIKTRDTWALSMSGAKDALADVANTAAMVAADKLSEVAVKGIGAVTNGVNDILNAGADEIKDAINDLEKNMQTAAEGVLESVVDNVLTSLMSEIENGINELQYVCLGQTTTDENGNVIDVIPSKEDVKAEAEKLFQNVRSKISTIVTEACGDNQTALTISGRIVEVANQFVTDIETDVIATINAAEDPDLTAYMAGKVNELKLTLIEHGNAFIANITDDIAGAARNAVSGIQNEMNAYVNQFGDEISEAATEKIHTKVSELTDNFVNTTLKVNGTTSSATDVKSSPVSMFKFGYKDYLMLLTYISICCGDSVLLRTSDVIQMNLQSAGEGADFQHKANTESGGKFKMADAYTYVSVTATAELDMFFMDLSIFQDQVTVEETLGPDDTGSDTTTAPAEDSTGTKITYTGLLGY